MCAGNAALNFHNILWIWNLSNSPQIWHAADITIEELYESRPSFHDIYTLDESHSWIWDLQWPSSIYWYLAQSYHQPQVSSWIHGTWCNPLSYPVGRTHEGLYLFREQLALPFASFTKPTPLANVVHGSGGHPNTELIYLEHLSALFELQTIKMCTSLESQCTELGWMRICPHSATTRLWKWRTLVDWFMEKWKRHRIH